MPKTLENYVQEIGRAGRDGRIAFCHLFLAKEDYVKHRSFSFSDYPDEASLWKILQKLFQLRKNDDGKARVVALKVSECEKELDIKDANLATILSYIELENPNMFQVLPGIRKNNPAIDGLVTVYIGRATTINELSNDHPFFASIEHLGVKARGGLEFNLFNVSADSKTAPRDIMSSMWSMQARKLIRFTCKDRFQYAFVTPPASEKLESFVHDLNLHLLHRLQTLENVRVLKLDEVPNF